MNPQKQLFRQPVRTLVMLFLLCVASAFLCLGFGVLSSSQETLKTIENQFVTVVYSNFTWSGKKQADGSMLVTPDFSREQQASILQLVRSVPFANDGFYQQYISAYNPALVPVTTAKEEGGYVSNLDAPYNRVIFEITIEECLDKGKRYDITAAIDKVLALYQDYTCRDHINFSYSLPLVEGGHYWVYGYGYYDLDLSLREIIAQSVRCSVNEVDWSNIGRNPHADDPETIAFYAEHPEYAWDPDELWYIHPTNGYMVSMTKDKLDCVEKSVLNVKDIGIVMDTESNTGQEKDTEWKSYQETMKKQYHTVPILGTDLLDGIYLFHEKEAFVTQGRSFEKEDYENGNSVCLISETLAASSGLAVGDLITFSFYQGEDYPYTGNVGDSTANPMAKVMVPGETFLDNRTYEIIGLYRQEKPWRDQSIDLGVISSSYAFTPNTVFVPNASLEGLPTYTSDSGIYSTMVLENGSIEEMKATLEAAGYSPDALTYFDGGYSELVGTLNSFRESAEQLFLASVLTWLAAAVVYLALFVFRQRRNAGLMVSLGSGRRKAVGFIWQISVLPVAAASAVGALIGMALMNGTLERVFASVQDVLSSDFSSTAGGHISVESTLVALPWTAALAALGQALILAVLIWLCALIITRRKPLDNIRGPRK